MYREAATSAWPSSPPPQPGEALGRYELVREIGRGGFAIVYEARDRHLGRAVALKVLHARADELRERRLLAEAEVAARLSHPNIVTVLDAGRAPAGVYLVEELLSGETLESACARGPLPLAEALRVGVEIARGLAHGHAQGVVHRDLSLRNVQRCVDGQVKILDLGMASAFGRRSVAGGSLDTMAPEQRRGAPEDERTDVFALGVVLFHLVTGRSPFNLAGPGGGRWARSVGLAEAPALATAIEAMLEEDPIHRPRDGAAALAALEAARASIPAAASVAPARYHLRRPPRLRWAIGGAVTGAVALVMSAVAFPAVRGWVDRPRPATVLAPTDRSTGCSWRLVSAIPLAPKPTGAVTRNGVHEGQTSQDVQGRAAWLQRSDWNQLFIRLPVPLPDTFSVQAQFYAPAAEAHSRDVRLMVFTDPGGPDASDVAHGRGIVLRAEPGRPPVFEWGVTDGLNARQVAYKGVLASPFSGAWRLLQIDGSRSGCWMRVLLDGAPLLAATGECDLTGRHLLLGAGGTAWKGADVAWSTVSVFSGTEDCR